MSDIKEQIVISTTEEYREIEQYILENHISTVMLVCGNSMKSLKIGQYFDELAKKIEIVKFSDYEPNPVYESVVKAVKIFNERKCGLIIAVGGGSAIDVAKCIKLYANMNHDQLYLDQKIIPNDIKIIAIPTTAGTGSEATKYAVIYYNGSKQSVVDDSCIPDMVILDSTTLNSLSDYQRKVTMLDAFCHAIESYWSINSTEKSKCYSREAIDLIIKHKDSYLENEPEGNQKMLIAANLAGKAINITQTTAGHAMCYKITSLYGVAHGHAAAMCLSKLWRYMINNTDKCIDSRGKDFLDKMFIELAQMMSVNEALEAVEVFDEFFNSLNLEVPQVKIMEN